MNKLNNKNANAAQAGGTDRRPHDECAFEAIDLPPHVNESLRKVLDYLCDAEAEEYESRPADERDGHIWEHLHCLQTWLSAPAEGSSPGRRQGRQRSVAHSIRRRNT